MNQHQRSDKPSRPAVLSVAGRAAALKDASRRLRRWPRERARPSLTAAARLAFESSGRDGKTAPQPNWKTDLTADRRRTTHALQKADMFTRHRQGMGHASSAARPMRRCPKRKAEKRGFSGRYPGMPTKSDWLRSMPRYPESAVCRNGGRRCRTLMVSLRID